MRLLVLSARSTNKGAVLLTNAGVSLVVKEQVPAPAIVDVNLNRFWAYNNKVYASAEIVNVRVINPEDLALEGGEE